MVTNCNLLWKMSAHSIWSSDHDSSKQKRKIIDIKTIRFSTGFDFKDGFPFLLSISGG